MAEERGRERRREGEKGVRERKREGGREKKWKEGDKQNVVGMKVIERWSDIEKRRRKRGEERSG